MDKDCTFEQFYEIHLALHCRGVKNSLLQSKLFTERLVDVTVMWVTSLVQNFLEQ
jgi:hypothetical protein